MYCVPWRKITCLTVSPLSDDNKAIKYIFSYYLSIFLDWVAAAASQPRDAALDNYVRLVINNFFAALDQGIPALGIPVMDPLNIGNLTIPTLQ